MKCITFLLPLVSATKYNAAYCGSWYQWRKNYKTGGKPGHKCSDIGPIVGELTHLFYAFAFVGSGKPVGPKPSAYTGKKYSVYNHEMSDIAEYKKLMNLKSSGRNKDLKILLSIGGWSFSDNDDKHLKDERIKADSGWKAEIFSDMASSPENRALFITSAVDFMNLHKFDGIDLDWEYPAMASRGGSPKDKKNFSLLVKEMKAKMGGKLLTAAVPVDEKKVDAGYEVKQIKDHLDFICLMAYDYYGSWKGTLTLPHAQLHGNENEFSGERAVKYWISQGMSKEKILFGWAAYARTINISPLSFKGDASEFLVGFETDNVVLIDTDRSATEKYGYSEGGMAAYNEIAAVPKLKAGKEVYNEMRQAAYKIVDDKFIMYDNEASVRCKAAFIKKEGLLGGFSWSLGEDMYADDFPLHKAFAEELQSTVALDTCGPGNAGATSGGSWDDKPAIPGASGPGTSNQGGDDPDGEDTPFDFVTFSIILAVVIALLVCMACGFWYWKQNAQGEGDAATSPIAHKPDRQNLAQSPVRQGDKPLRNRKPDGAGGAGRRSPSKSPASGGGRPKARRPLE